MAQKLHDRAFAAVVAGFEADLVPVGQRAADGWPVVSGRSRASLFVRVGAVSNVYSYNLEIGNAAPYAGLIADGEVADRLLFQAVRVAAQRAAITIGRAAVGLR